MMVEGVRNDGGGARNDGGGVRKDNLGRPPGFSFRQDSVSPRIPLPSGFSPPGVMLMGAEQAPSLALQILGGK